MSNLRNLSVLKYSELQKLAKDVGIKANMKSEKLKKALEDFYQNGVSDTCTVSETKSSEPEVTKVKSAKTDETNRADNESRPAKRRRSTFEIVPDPEVCTTVEETREKKKARRDSLSEKKEARRESLHVGEMIHAMKPEMSTEDLKDSLIAAIEKKVEKKMTEEEAKDGSTSQIPRFAAFLAKKKAEAQPVTPGNKNWTKIHEKNFSKMDSIDVYLEKKKKRNLSISNSLKRAHEVASKTREAMLKLSNHKTPQPNKIRTGLPLPFASPFKPSVTSTKSMKLKFGGNAKTPVFGGRKTPSAVNSVNKTAIVRRSPRNTENSPTIKVTKSEIKQKIESRKSFGALNNTVLAEKRKSCVTPFKPLNMTLDSQSLKKTFNLKASLSKPLSWKPYTGKLKPIDNKPKPVAATKNHNIDIKTAHQKTSKAHRIAEAKGRRSDKKFNDQMKRRGIVA